MVFSQNLRIVDARTDSQMCPMIVSAMSRIQPGRLDAKIAAEHPEHHQLNSLASVRAEVKSVRPRP